MAALESFKVQKAAVVKADKVNRAKVKRGNLVRANKAKVRAEINPVTRNQVSRVHSPLSEAALLAPRLLF